MCHGQAPPAKAPVRVHTAKPLLPHDSLNDNQQPTILLIPGAFASKETFKPLHAHLTAYHLLIPTLPGHADGSSKAAIQDLTLLRTSAHLSTLVAAKAPSGKVHVVGHSFGANVALHFAAHHPSQILSLFVSGTAGFIASRATPYALWLEGLLTLATPTRLTERLLDVDPALRGMLEFGGVRNLALCKALCRILAVAVDSEELVPAGARGELEARGVRVLALAATKRGLLPTDDNLARARLVVQRMGGVVVEVPTMRHGWYYQDPGLFASVVAAWVEDRELPAPAIVRG